MSNVSDYAAAQRAAQDLLERPITRATSGVSADDSFARQMGLIFQYLLKSNKGVEDKVTGIESSLTNTQADIADLKKENTLLRTELNAVKLQISETQKNQRVSDLAVSEMNDRLCTVDHIQRRSNIVIEGVDPSPNENLPNIVRDIITKFDPHFQANEIDYVMRLGPGRRTILVVFVRATTRDRVLASKTKMKQYPTLQHVFISEDSNPEVRSQKADIRSIGRLAQSQNIEVKPRGRGLIYSGQYYPHANLSLLPPELHLEHTRTRIGVDFVAYYSHLSVLSNMYPCTVSLEGHSFNCVEQAYSYRKAVYFGDNAAKQKVLDASDGYAAKKAAKHLKSSDWDARAEAQLYELDLCKFTQNKLLQTYLLNTGNKRLLEATHDPTWGTACPLGSPLIPQGAFKGRNMAGAVLCDVRNEVRRSLNQTPATVTATPQGTPS